MQRTIIAEQMIEDGGCKDVQGRRARSKTHMATRRADPGSVSPVEEGVHHPRNREIRPTEHMMTTAGCEHRRSDCQVSSRTGLRQRQID